jgi:hypothetical protein
MANGRWEDYAGSPREFDRWLKANAILGSLLAIAILGAALAGLYSAPRNGPTALSSVNVMQSEHAERADQSLIDAKQ